MKITLENTVETHKMLSTFENIEDMNTSIKAHKKINKDELTKSTYAVLDFISQWSCKHLGVSYLCQKKLAESLQVSYKTIQRAIADLVKLNIVRKYHTKRATGDKRQSSNIIVIQRFVENVHPECPPKEALKKTQDLKDTNDTGKEGLSTEKVSNQELIKKGLVTKLPETLQKALAPFFSADEIYALAGTIYKAKSKVDKNIRIEDHEDKYRECILSVINALKRGKVKSLHGLLFHSIKVLTRSIWLREGFDAFYGFED